MVNATAVRCGAVLLLAALVLTGAASLRSAEYDEQYTLFVTAGVARPDWPDTPFHAGDVQRLQAGHGDLAGIARDLRRTDVHPPLYFWAVALWRLVFGPSLFTARLLSVLCSLAALAAIGGIALRAGIPPALAMLLTLGCYGFAYTGAVARGFALAQALTLAGVLVLLRARGRHAAQWGAGMLLGAAAAANYLALFAGGAALFAGSLLPGHRTPCGVSRLLWSGLGLAPWLGLDLWFFLAQHGSRSEQFPPFQLWAALHRLALYVAANVFGGLPIYVGAGVRTLLDAALAGLLLVLSILVVLRWRRVAHPEARAPLAAAAIAPALGLLLLGVTFNTTPIELRYLAFATPFAALLLAGMLASLPHWPRLALTALVLAVQAAALGGLLTRPETMQPARAAAHAAAELAANRVVLLPRGNDGVGIVGAFAGESRPDLRLLLVAATDTPAQLRARTADMRRVALALLAQDAASRAAVPHMLAAFPASCWRRAAERSNVVLFNRVCGGE